MDLIVSISQRHTGSLDTNDTHHLPRDPSPPVLVASNLNASQVSAAIHKGNWNQGARTGGAVKTASTTTNPTAPIPDWLSAMREYTNESISYMATVVKGKA